MIRRLAAVALVTVALVSVAGPAVALPNPLGDCKTAPTPGDPYLGGALSSNVPTPLPQPGDPWAANSTTTILEQYGTTGTSYDVYDNGCAVGSDVLPAVMTQVANLIGLFPKFAVTLTASLGNWTLNPGSWLGTLDAPIDAVSASLFASFTQPFMPILLIVAAIALVVAARKARWSSAFTTLAVGLLGLALVFLAVIGPSKVTHAFDGVVQTGVTTAMSGTVGNSTDPSVIANPGTRIISPMWDALAYDQWLEGELGSATSPTAVKYGPALFRAHTMSWSEATTAHQSVDAMTAMVDQKKADWTAVAGEIQTTDPAAYDYLTGNRGWERVGSALTQWVLLIPLIFPATALGMVLLGYLIFRYVGGFLPVLGALIVIPRWHSVVRFIGSILAAAVVNTIIFAAGGSAVIAITNTLLKSALPKWLTLLVISGVSVVAWMALKPFRSLTRLVSNPVSGMADTLDAPGNLVAAGKKLAGKAIETAAGLELFALAGGHLAAGNDGEDPESARPEVAEVPQDVPAPQDVPTSTYQVQDDTPTPAAVTAPSVAPAISPPDPVSGEVQDAPAAPVEILPPQDDPDVVQMRPELVDGEETFVMYEPETGEFTPSDASVPAEDVGL